MNLKKEFFILVFICVILCVNVAGCSISSSSTSKKDNEATITNTAYQTYEFETYDGESVTIDVSNIVSQMACDEPLEWDELPADAEQMAPGRDFILFADENNYYVEDATNGLVTVATIQ